MSHLRREIQHHDERRDVALQAVQELRMAVEFQFMFWSPSTNNIRHLSPRIPSFHTIWHLIAFVVGNCRFRRSDVVQNEI